MRIGTGAARLLLACTLVLGTAACQDGGGDGAAPATTSGTATASGTRTGAASARPTASDGLPEVRAASLPAEARTTLRLISAGGPFPYRQDGTVFGNREGLLPRERSGYYHEYTVPTPGSRDRGARRIIAGGAGERYYTADHYRSFARVAG
ncbi:ribonuclease domain-containing protein [Actinomadura parmotrematis]|uniref:Guanine-specific ribonuclease N1 and T1 n=1 Tax=Actinomadura parmotrematis TaxID=2864039 RepID=A0ABS7G2U2_9ACTN|nr:ribonuclease domain-containing protein [Actinomadura parmotrematis]MBW8487042.1 guanine-specific ribonuclease N1 and T1 [Actinomadura parmotrematis]